MSRRFQYNLKDLFVAPVLVGAGFVLLLNSTSPSWIRFAAILSFAGAFFGAAIGVFARRPWIAALYGACAWFLFAVFALVINFF